VAKKLYDLAVKTGEYTDSTGAKKGRWQNVGAVMLSDDGSKFMMLAKWFNPAGVPDLSGRNSESVLLSMFEPKQGGDQGAGQAKEVRQNGAPTKDKINDDLPF